MGFFKATQEQEINIDYSQYTPVNVIATFNRDKMFKPLYFSINYNKVKIDAIRFTKDYKHYITYICLYKLGTRQRECELTYYIKKHIWVLKNPS